MPAPPPGATETITVVGKCASVLGEWTSGGYQPDPAGRDTDVWLEARPEP